jgi:hypothetical protein
MTSEDLSGGHGGEVPESESLVYKKKYFVLSIKKFKN